jgi:hypothetical protein
MVEPYFRRLVLRSVAHIIRLYSSSLITECEVQYAKLYLFILNFVLLTTKEQAHEMCSADDYDLCKFSLLMCVHPISVCAQVFLSMLVKATFLDLPLWHRILVLEILRVIVTFHYYYLHMYVSQNRNLCSILFSSHF